MLQVLSNLVLHLFQLVMFSDNCCCSSAIFKLVIAQWTSISLKVGDMSDAGKEKDDGLGGVNSTIGEEHWESATSVGCRSSGLCVLYMWGEGVRDL